MRVAGRHVVDGDLARRTARSHVGRIEQGEIVVYPVCHQAGEANAQEADPGSPVAQP